MIEGLVCIFFGGLIAVAKPAHRELTYRRSVSTGVLMSLSDTPLPEPDTDLEALLARIP